MSEKDNVRHLTRKILQAELYLQAHGFCHTKMLSDLWPNLVCQFGSQTSHVSEFHLRAVSKDQLQLQNMFRILLSFTHTKHRISHIQIYWRSLGFVFGCIVWTSSWPVLALSLRHSLKIFNLSCTVFMGSVLGTDPCTQTVRRAADADILTSGSNTSSLLIISFKENNLILIF